ncbi:WD40 repeat-like protein [Linnemannia elongata AG-77]|uniref:WD40 repeat-like protein n=1 Tax=Linnemannia elongata AG-77 TaxID=1314771 RepID=A0A197JN05_9FUNG|nr:WD40 repeat-like protein [Linnemannia elongata AG-77]
MSSSLPYEHSRSQSSASNPLSTNHGDLTNNGKRTLPQPDRPAKSRRSLSATTSNSTALQGIQHYTIGRFSSFCDSTSWNPHSSTPFTLPYLSPIPVREIPTVEYAISTLKNQRLEEYKQAVYIPPLAKSNLQAPYNNLFSLIDKVHEFLVGDDQVMLILGDSGAGKSTFIRHLEYKLWNDYEIGGRFPLFINLPALERPEKDLIVEQLWTYKFSEMQIQELEQNRQLLLICDGYDECQLTVNLHTTNLLNRTGHWKAKLLITCRTQYLGPDYRDCFIPTAVDRYHRVTNNLFQEAVIAPFSKSQIEIYVDHYVPLEPRTWVKDDYLDKLTTIPNLMDLARNPFLLTLALESLPRVVRGATNLSSIHITRVELYDIFVEHWLGVNKRRLQSQKLRVDDQITFNELKDDGFERNGIKFQQDLAAAIFREQDGKPVVDYSHRRDKNSWKAAFFGPEPDTSLLRGASLLSRAGNQNRFVHQSVLEYFYSRTVRGPVNDDDEFAPQPHLDTTTSPPIEDHPLSKRSLASEPSIAQFLAERVTLDPGFKQELLAIIERSKNDQQAAVASANAINILVRAGLHFNGSDLQGIRIPRADLSGGQFDSAQLQGADLKGVNFSKSWIRQADFGSAQMEGARFGELSYLKEAERVEACVLSPDGRLLATGLKNGDINIYNTTTWRQIRVSWGHSHGVSSLAYSPDGHQILSGSKDRTLRLWDFSTTDRGGLIRVLPYSVTSVVFSPTGRQFAFAGTDRSVSLCNAQTANVLFILQGHTRPVTGLAYSPDGEQIACCSHGGTIRIFNTQTGLLIKDMESHSEGIRCIAYSPDGRRFVSGFRKGILQLWEMASDRQGPTWRAHTDDVSCTRFSPNGLLIASSCVDGTVKLWDTQARSLLSVFVGHHKRVTSLMFNPDGSQLVSSSRDKTIRFWEVSAAGSGLGLHGPSDPVSGVAFSPSGLSLVSCRQNGTVQQHNAVSGELEQVFSGSCLQASCIAYSKDGLQIATAGREGNIHIWDVTTGKSEFVLQGDQDGVEALAFSPCGQWIATGSKGNIVQLWKFRCGGESVHTFTGHSKSVTTLAFSLTGLQITSKCKDNTFQIWREDTGDFRAMLGRYLGGPDLAIDYSPSGRQDATSLLSEVRPIDVHGADEPYGYLPRHDNIYGLAFSSCGQWIVIRSERSIRLWNSVARYGTQTWRCMAVIEEFFGQVNSVAWRPGLLEFATGCDDGSVRVWKVLERSGRVSVQMIWSSGPAVLASTGALIANAVGLSTTNRALLKQRGAIYNSLVLDKEE